MKLRLADMGKLIGVSAATILRYESGEIKIPEDRLRKYSEISGFDVDWFLRSEEINPKAIVDKGADLIGINADLLRQIILGLEQGLAERGLLLPPDKKAELIILLYEQAVKTKEVPTQQTVQRYLRLVA